MICIAASELSRRPSFSLACCATRQASAELSSGVLSTLSVGPTDSDVKMEEALESYSLICEYLLQHEHL
jgi:hypothetical protein